MCIFAAFTIKMLTKMTMKQVKIVLALFVMTVFAASCEDKGKIIEGLQLKNDSLFQVSSQQQDIIDGLAQTMEEITYTMDTIASQERSILSGVDERGIPLTKRNMRAKLESLSNLIKDQHFRLDSLGKALEGSNATVRKLRGVVTMLTKSLEERTKEIDNLKATIADKDVNINKLGTQVANLTDTVNTIKNENASQRQTIARQEQNINQQDTQMHEVYYIMGTKDELLAAGAIVKQGGLFKKKKVNFANVNKNNLKKADIRQFKSINIPSKKPVIMGDVPEDSYTLVRNENSSTLTITNPTKFWSSNNRVLVIQVK